MWNSYKKIFMPLNIGLILGHGIIAIFTDAELNIASAILSWLTTSIVITLIYNIREK